TVQNPNGAIDLLGTAARKLIVEALDADGNVIFGPGAPSFAVARTSGTLNLVLTQPTVYAPDVFTIQPPGNFSNATATLTITASYGNTVTNGCAQTGAVCMATQTVDMKELLAVANGSGSQSVTLYELPLATPFATISTGVLFPQALVFDSSGDVFVANCGSCAASQDNVAEFTPPYNGAAAATLTANVSGPIGLALDPSGNLFVANAGTVPTVAISAPPYSTSTAIATGGTPYAVALDTSDDLYVVNQVSNTMTAYTPPWTGAPILTISNGINTPVSMGLDGAGDVFVLNQGSTGSLTEYAVPLTNGMNATNTITNGITTPGTAMAMYGNDAVVPTHGAGNHVQIYDPPYSSGMNPTTTVTNGLNVPSAVAIDGTGTLFALNTGANDVTTYGGNGFSFPGPILTVPGLTSPQAIALLP
ncbi:MAG: hypothetical protein JO199_04060, partial [Candidatus Eremiobacteraeota bacterium]|nr:hypothetical protein [Candidatus Eremiobacteraeota bacterium]